MASNLDTTGFNSPNGFIITNFTFSPQENYGEAIVLQNDGKIVMAGYVKNNSLITEIGLVRYNSDGTYDSTFGTSGLATAQLSDSLSVPSNVQVYGLTLQSDGKIIVCGNLFTSSNFYDIFVARFLTNGSLDTSFGGIGYVLTTPSNFSSVFAPTNFDNCFSHFGLIDSISGIDKIVICGFIRVTPTNEYRIVLARYLQNGTLDGTFGTSGLVQTNLSTTADKFGLSLAISNTGDYYVTGYQQTTPSPPDNNFIVAKFNNTGSIVGAFGSSGLVVISSFFTGSSDGAKSVKIQQDGKIVAAGTSIKQPTGEECFAICRLDATTGILDTTFGGTGKVVTDLSTQSPPIYLNGNSLAIQTDNKLVLGGYFYYPTTFNQEESFALARYNTDGTLDTSFGINGNGLILQDLVTGTMKEKGLSVAIQPNGQILLGGVMGEFSDISDTKYFILARYFGFPPFPPPPIPVIPICFPAGTPVRTDQGNIPIEQIDPNINTIGRKPIVAITKSLMNEDSIVCIEKNSLGINIPNRKTYISNYHGIIYNNKLIPAKQLVGRLRGIYSVKYYNQILYNVLMEKHYVMIVNNMRVETLNPKNIVAKLYTNDYSDEEKSKLILEITENTNNNRYNHEYKSYNSYEKIINNRTRRNLSIFRFNPLISKLNFHTKKNFILDNSVTRNNRYHIPFLRNNSTFKINSHTLRHRRRRRKFIF